MTVKISDIAGYNSSRSTVQAIAHGFVAGDVVYYTGSAWAKAQANSLTTLGLGVVYSVIDANNFNIQFSGYLASTFSGLTPGATYYLSAASAGAITTTKPAIVQTILVALSATVVIIGDFGLPGASGYSGISGFSGYSGISGFSGYSGISGFSGYSGLMGLSDDTTTNATMYPIFSANTSAGPLKVSSTKMTYNPSTGAFGATSKSFIIDHPTKRNKKLHHGSLEGPEFGVYVRGKSKERIIDLPEYWAKLVDYSTITVSLTPIGKFQELSVSIIDDDKIHIQSSSKNIEYYFIIFAERKDISSLVVEADVDPTLIEFDFKRND